MPVAFENQLFVNALVSEEDGVLFFYFLHTFKKVKLHKNKNQSQNCSLEFWEIYENTNN